MPGPKLADAIVNGRIADAPGLARELLDSGMEAKAVMEKVMIPAMETVGKLFEQKEYFVPEVLVSAHAMKAALGVVEPLLSASGIPPAGKVVLGTVEGDLHEIGKNIVAMMLQGAGFSVVNLGVDVPAGKFVQAAAEHGAHILGMSSLLTTAMKNMRDIVDGLAREGLRDRVRVMVGGAAVTPEFARRIGADFYCADANEAVRVAKEIRTGNGGRP
ncbi:MAG: corrinoid protein [Thermodesulfobacteriota bacterium]